MPGFMAGFVWYWGKPCPDPVRGGTSTSLVRNHVILGGAPSEVLDCISKFFGGEIVTYKTPNCFSPANLVIVLKNNCKEHVSVRRQNNFNAIVNNYDMRD